MSDRTRLYREFAKTFAKKVANVLATIATLLAVGAAVIGVLYLISEVTTFILNMTPIRNTELNNLVATIYLIIGLVALLAIAHSAWVEAKAETEADQ